ncbi:hypothetical protein FGG08_003136 [Glutinoglossum americanum]|uniref:Uncharacterized protein n=1 Tax=Glutinoglossum americanum TaxID=1670608 RepID=A0A9P8L3X4_9PEZI|nr:hypothetical protein FGG08_003136 [Glutinoglossum americanum]
MFASNEPGKSIRDQLCLQLDGLPENEKLQQVLAILDTAAETEEQVAEIIWEAWDYLKIHRLWQCRYPTFEALQDAIGYEEALKDIIQKHDILTVRKQREARGIHENWGALPHKSLPAHLCPPKFSECLLRALNQLSRTCSLNQAIVLLDHEIARRHSKLGKGWGVSKEPYVLRRDVLEVLSQPTLLTPGHSPYNGQSDGAPPIDFTIEVERANTQYRTTTDRAEDMDKGDGEDKEEDEAEDMDKGDGEDEDEEGDEVEDMDKGDGEDEDEEGDEVEDMDKGDGEDEDEEGDEVEDMDKGDGEDEDEEGDEVEDMDKGDGEDEDEEGDEVEDMDKENDGEEEEVEDIENDESDEETAAVLVLSSYSCSCSSAVIKDIQGMEDKNPNDDRGLRLLAKALQLGLHNVCHNHLRTLAKVTVGLQNNMSSSKLRKRLQDTWRNKSHLDDLRRRNPHWFLKTRRPETDADRLVVYRYHPVPPKAFRFNETRVFERFAGPGSWGGWQRDGTIIIPRLFSFLSRPDIGRKIDVEFDLYRYHHRSLPGRSRLGWLRNMFYSIIQQTVRQDPVWYAISAAARPDKNWRLISYPYITKDTDPGENTGFLHLDLNTAQYVKDGSGGNLLSSSIALDDEQADGCTVGVPGFHRHIHDWHNRLVERGEDTAGFTTNCSTAYRAQDRKDWGEPIPMPCPALGLRLTRPEIIHGSTPHSYRRRRSLFAWYTGIDEAHINLDLKGTLLWNDLAACHRDLEAPSREPSGQAPRYGLPGFRFPGSVIVGPSSAIGDALVGRRKWTDPQVIRELDILLGDDDAAAHAYVGRVRAKMMKQYEEAFEQLEITETEAFGENSYFRQKELGLPLRSDDNSDGRRKRL